MVASTIYIAAAINRFNQAADISPGPSSLIAFGSSHLLALWDVQSKCDGGVFRTLPGSESLITCVKFLRDSLFVAANDTGKMFLWKKDTSQWKFTASVQAHSSAISTLCALNDYLVTGASDSLMKIWKIGESESKDEFIETQLLDLGGKLPLASALSSLPHSTALLLAVGCTDSKVWLWVSNHKGELVHSATLTGHEDWIRSLAFSHPADHSGLLVLASGSQDATIRLWNIEPRKGRYANKATTSVDELMDNFEALLDGRGENEGGRQISLKHQIITVNVLPGKSQEYMVTFDALLVGHEAGVTSLTWRLNGVSSTPTLLSTSTDSSLILWSPSVLYPAQDRSSSVWINRQRFGDVGGQRLGGFVGGLWAHNGTEVLAWAWAGGWRRWRISLLSNNDVMDETWIEVGAITGHNGPVKGLDWSPDGKYLISSSLDQTTRIHGPVPMRDSDRLSWHEIARPQVHGYDLHNVVFVNPLKVASIADEKVVRVFEAPRGFVDLVSGLKIAQFGDEKDEGRPLAASVPPLGLSNRAIREAPPELTDQTTYSRRPFDGELAAMTLWPEVEKIFGHGFESITLGISNSRKLMATACRATNAEHAPVRVYDTENYKIVGKPLHGHDLTVTRISFSPDDRHILTVSRDRSWRLFGLQEGSFKLVATEKAHGRIIWDCAWSAEGDIFATASRDKSVKIWTQKGDKWTAVAVIHASYPATAIAFCPANGKGRRYLSIGLECGQILIYSAVVPSEWRRDEIIGSDVAHVDHIHRMLWRPSAINPHELATCSEDGTLRIIRVQLACD